MTPEDDVPATDREQSDADNAAAVASQHSASTEREAARVQAQVDQSVTNDRIDRLIETSERQAAANEDLALATVEYQERARLARLRFRVTIAAIALVMTGIVVMFALILASLNSGHSVRDTLLDCVQPTGKCYQRGQTQTGELVGALNKVTALAAACAPDYVSLPVPQRFIAIQSCIQRGLK